VLPKDLIDAAAQELELVGLCPLRFFGAVPLTV
jgi:hypothetical protein